MNMDHIAEALKTLGLSAKILSAAERQDMLMRLRDQLGVNSVGAIRPWDRTDASDEKFRPDGWELIPAFVGSASCLFFSELTTDIWKFRNGDDLLRVLSECPAMEFYVWDPATTYLLCHNHHDYVIGWGTAVQWVTRIEG